MGFYKVHCKKCQKDWEVMCNYDALKTLTCGHVDHWGRKMLFDTEWTEAMIRGGSDPRPLSPTVRRLYPCRRRYGCCCRHCNTRA